MKKYIAIGLGVAVLLVVMMACGQQTQEQEKPEQPTQEVQQSESVSTEPAVPPVETEPQDELKTSEVPEVTEPTEPVRAEDDQQAETEPVVESATKPAATPQENKPQEPPKSPANQGQQVNNDGNSGDTFDPDEWAQRVEEARKDVNGYGMDGSNRVDMNDPDEYGDFVEGIVDTIGGGNSGNSNNSGDTFDPDDFGKQLQESLQGYQGGDASKRVDMNSDEYEDFVEGIVDALN